MRFFIYYFFSMLASSLNQGDDAIKFKQVKKKKKEEKKEITIINILQFIKMLKCL